MVTGVKGMNTSWPHQRCGTHNTCSACLAGQGDALLTPHSALQPNPALLPATIYLPLYLPTRSCLFSVSQYQISFSMSTANPFWCCLCPSKNTMLDYSSIGFNPLPKPPSFALFWRSKSPPNPFPWELNTAACLGVAFVESLLCYLC